MTNTRKFLAIVMVVVMCLSMFSTTAFATDTTIANGTAGEGVTWKLTDDGVLTISGTGEMDTEWYAPPWEEYNESITEVVVEEGITEISDTAFCSAENLVTVSIPATVTYVTGYAFDGCKILEKINVAEENTAYKSIDGILFTEDEKTLVMYPANKICDKYTIPSSITTIGKFAFEGNQGINTVIIPSTVTVLESDTFDGAYISTIIFENGVDTIPQSCFSYSNIESIILSDSIKTINSAAFYGAWGLETLVIGSGVESIDEDILSYTDELTVVHYKGTQEDWDAISIHEENEGLNNKELHFIAGEIKEETAPTCADGHTAGYYCETCEDYLTGEVISATDEHDWNNGVCDGCSEVCGHADEDFNEKCDVCELTLEYEEVEADETNTVHIPEADKAVVVKFTPTESGWYAVVSDNGGDDENNDPYVSVFDADGEEIEYDDDSDYEDTYNFYCEFEAEAGETYYIVLSNYYGDVEYDYTIEKHIGIDHQPTPAEPYVTLTWDLEAEYQWYNLDDGEVAIDGETEATLQNPIIGSIYGCLVTYNGVEYYSDMLFYSYAITHQPTADEPYVELNDDTDATYQWYLAEEAIVELTDENAIAFPSEDEGPVYDTENGWSGVHIGRLEGTYDCYAYFIVPLEAGDTISIELLGGYYGRVEFEDMMSGGYYIGEVDEDGKCDFTAKEDGLYAVCAYRDIDGDEVFVKAYADGYNLIEIDGATDALYAPTEDGLYVCEVTFTDGTTEMSEILEIKSGWLLENGKWAYYEKGVKATNRWILDSVGWCYVGADGYCVTNKWVADSHGWCYLGADGRMVTNKWVMDSVGWCYVGADGYCVTNKWVADSKGWCYLGADGRMVTNKWVMDSKGWCYVGADGYCVTNKWVADSKGWCYLDVDGRMVTNKWVKDSVGWCYVGSNGYMVTSQWVQDGGKWYYLDGNGYMVTGTKTIGGKTYKFNSSGVWIV